MDEEMKSKLRRSKRKEIDENFEFILYLDAYKASAVNISEDGIRFDTETPIYIRLQLTVNGEKETRDAQLVWAKKKDGGGVSYGFEFVPDMD